MLRLAGGEALEERRAAVFDAVENRPIQLRRVGDGNLRDERRAVAGEEGLGDGLLLDVLALRGASPNMFMSLPPSIGVESEFCPPVLEYTCVSSITALTFGRFCRMTFDMFW